MKDQEKTREETIKELRQRIAELEAAEARRQKADEALRKAKDELELRVEERTVELRAINQGLLREIADRRAAETALRESERKFRLVTETIQDVFWMSTPNITRIVYVSPGYEKIWNRTTESLYQSPESFLDSIHPDDREQLIRLLRDHHLNGKEYTCEYRIVLPDDSIRWILERGFPIHDDNGVLTLMCGVSTDITERKKAEELLRQAGHRYRRLFEDAPLMYVITRDEEGVPFISDCNELFLGSVGYSREDVVGKPLADFYSSESRLDLFEGGGYKRALAGEFFIGERLLLTRDGRLIPTLLYTVTELDPSGQVTGTRAMFVDITDRKKAEDALRQSEQMLKAILSASPVGIIVTRDRRIKWANDTWIKMFGFNNEREYLDQPTSIMHHSQENYEHARKILYDSLHPGQVSEADLTLERKDGTPFDSHVRIRLVDASDPSKGTISVISDISDRKKAEEALRESEERYRAVVDNVEIGISLLDSNLEIGLIRQVRISWCERHRS